jgi:hypothetical protein
MIDIAILTTLYGLARFHGKHYCIPSQDKILQLLTPYFGRRSRRSLNYQLRRLEDAGWLKRRRRHRYIQGRGWCFKSTLYTFTRKALKWLCSFSGARRVQKQAQYSSIERIVGTSGSTGPSLSLEERLQWTAKWREMVR